MTKQDPLVSILLPVIGPYSTWKDTYESLYNQSYSCFEISILPIGERANIFVKKDDRTHIMDTSTSIEDAWNLGLTTAKGEFIALAQAGSVWLSDKLQVQLVHFCDQKDLIVCATSIHSFLRKRQNSTQYGLIKSPVSEFSRENIIYLGTALIQRSFLQKHNLSFRKAEGEYGLWADIVVHGGQFYIESQELVFMPLSANKRTNTDDSSIPHRMHCAILEQFASENSEWRNLLECLMNMKRQLLLNKKEIDSLLYLLATHTRDS